MTKDERKEKRQVKHALQRAASRHLSTDARAVMTGRQMKVAGLRIADMLLSGQNPREVVRIP